jgi:dCTP deaminase
VDHEIVAAAHRGQFISENFDPSCVKQACYELRASDIFYEVLEPREDKRAPNPAGTGYTLRPHCLVTVITHEKIKMPVDAVARVMTKGQLFSIGIAHAYPVDGN